jgi:hypothetical protein
MVGTVNRGVLQSDIQPQNLSGHMNGNCVLVSEKYHEASVELKSLCLINKMLQEGIKYLRSQEE